LELRCKKKPAVLAAIVFHALGFAGVAHSVSAADQAAWMNTALSPDERARLLERELTLDERIGLVHSPLFVDHNNYKRPPGLPAAAGYVAGVPRLGIPALVEANASLGVVNPSGQRPGETGTALASGLSLAATWNPGMAQATGAMIAREAHAKGFNVLLAGAANLVRDPRNGRNFEYLSEDPWLTGVMAGASISGIQGTHVMSTLKHFAINAYETSRKTHNAVIAEAPFRASDLLAFQLAIERGNPGAVMCGYNRINGPWACESEALLGKVLKGDWTYKGWVMSDWGAVPSLGAWKVLDHQSGEQLDKQVWFGAPLRQAVADGTVPAERLSDMTTRILRSMFASCLFDHPPAPAPLDMAAHGQLARQASAEGIVLLRNQKALLPLGQGQDIQRIAVIGGNASTGVLSGGGSSQVMPYGQTPQIVLLGGTKPLEQLHRRAMWTGPSPLAAIRERAGKAEVEFNDGRYPASAAELARKADVAIVFATQWNGEGEDTPDMSLPNGQDALIAAVAAANPRTIVVLQSGNPVDMPWLDKTAAVLEAWYPGQQGAAAIADVLFGQVNPSGRLPVTFPKSVRQLPRPALPGFGLPPNSSYDIQYQEGSDVGYRWFARTGAEPLFPFGFGLSYTRFAVSDLKVEGGKTLSVSFAVKNTGQRAGADVPQVYLRSAAGKRVLRLIGFDKLTLAPGEQKRVSVVADPRLLADFSTEGQQWRIAAGDYRVSVSAHAGDKGLAGGARVEAQTLKP
jgi:beta-glucosidase